MPAIAAVWMRLCTDRHGFLPFVLTVGGFVVLGADIIGVRTMTRCSTDGW
ncbi:hypothetical protein [Nocardioides psychrotolerans]|nr:hypothetical protein [Nocardioides psychrotolerans]